MEKTAISVQGMSCDHCVKAITGSVGGLDGVSSVQVDLHGGAVSVSYEPDKVSLESIKEAIEDAGYEVA